MNHSKTNPRAVNQDNFPALGTTKEQLRFLLNYAVLAPSLHNSQPWLFKLTEQSVEIRLNQNIAISIVDPNNRELIISCGAALGNLEVAARYFGFQTRVQLSNEEDATAYLAKVSINQGVTATQNDIALFKALTLRQTHRGLFGSEKISNDILEKCSSVALLHEVEFSYFGDAKIKSEVAKLTVDADKNQFSKPWFRVELASWLHSNKKQRKDGMSAHRFGIPDKLTPVTRFLIRHFNIGSRITSSNQKKMADDASVLGVFATQSDTHADWLNSGRALSKVLLSLTSLGFSASYLNQPIEVGVFRSLLRRVLSTLSYPQIMLRIGKANSTTFSVRRTVEDVTTK